MPTRSVSNSVTIHLLTFGKCILDGGEKKVSSGWVHACMRERGQGKEEKVRALLGWSSHSRFENESEKVNPHGRGGKGWGRGGKGAGVC